jgi:CheY-like chemotaxis protein
MVSLLDDGLAKVEEGVTSIDEELRAAPAGTEVAASEEKPVATSPGGATADPSEDRSAPPGAASQDAAPAGRPEAAREPQGPLPAWPPPSPPPSSAPLQPEPGRDRILVVDDEPAVLHFLCHVLEDAWYQVFPAESARRALEIAMGTPLDLIITDLDMPGMDGASLVHRLRGNPRTRDVPVIFLSGRSDEEDEGRGLLAGADDYLFKPIGARRLIMRVEAALRRARERAQEPPSSTRTRPEPF